MEAVTLTAGAKTALILWAFMPFNRIQDAHKFMDSLPATANASLAFGIAQTDQEIADDKADRLKEERKKNAERADCRRCVAEAAKLGTLSGDLGKKDLPKLKSKLGTWEMRYSLSERAWKVRCPEEYYFSLATAIRVPFYRWIVTYRKEPQ